MKHRVYDDTFYKNRNEQTKYAARKIINILFDYFEVESAIDIGCGVGTWLNELKNQGIKKVKGLDGDYVNRKYLVIDNNEFVPTDISDTINVKEKYDLAISLEVAEHLPIERAKSFVSDLCKMSDVVMFSAAIKFQGGDNHINEQRISYWIQLFKNNGYEVMDIIRPEIWTDIKIPVWYRENMVIFVNKYKFDKSFYQKKSEKSILDMVHPELYEAKIKYYEKVMKNPVIKIYLFVGKKIKKLMRSLSSCITRV